MASFVKNNISAYYIAKPKKVQPETPLCVSADFFIDQLYLQMLSIHEISSPS